MDNTVVKQLINDKKETYQMIEKIDELLSDLSSTRQIKNAFQGLALWFRRIFIIVFFFLSVCAFIFILFAEFESEEIKLIPVKFGKSTIIDGGTLNIKYPFYISLSFPFILSIVFLVAIGREYKLHRNMKKDTEILANISFFVSDYKKELKKNLRNWQKEL